jgi:hypothetical protein
MKNEEFALQMRKLDEDGKSSVQSSDVNIDDMKILVAEQKNDENDLDVRKQ